MTSSTQFAATIRRYNKKQMLMIRLVIAFIIAQIFSGFAVAGGPLVLEGSKGNTPVTYSNPNITVHVESGDLNAETDNAAAELILQDAFNLWNMEITSTINLSTNLAALASEPDINSGNFEQYIPSVDGSEFNGNDDLNPIVYDSDGAIIDAFFGEDASDDIIGFSASIFNVNGTFFNEGYAVINGKTLNPPLTETEFKLLIAHEMGHFIGLDHTQVDISNQETDFDICSISNPGNYPVMYPFVCRNEAALHADDISAVSALYPASNINDSFGILQGHFVDESGKAILGANIWAKDDMGVAISIVSDYLKQGNGFYKLYLPPGNYTLHANSINLLFNGGSSIGPYANDADDKSFVYPHPIPEVEYQGEASGNAVIIIIDAGQTLDIVFSITGNDSVLVNPPAESSGSSGKTSYITLLVLLSFLFMSRFSAIPATVKLCSSTTAKTH